MTNKNQARILIVEDDTPLAMMMVSLLTRAGCDTLVARTGEKGMELALTQKFDLITLDVDLPDMNGFEICSELKQRHLSSRTPIVFVSGRTSEEDRQRAHEVGAVDFVEKPFDAVEFISRILSHFREDTLA
jgi:DNA-binding response OmpR family regulator